MRLSRLVAERNSHKPEIRQVQQWSLRYEQTRRHGRNVAHDWPEGHLIEDLALQVDARRDFDQLHAVDSQSEDRALGHVQDILSALTGDFAAERDLFHAVHKLADSSLAANRHSSTDDFDVEVSLRK